MKFQFNKNGYIGELPESVALTYEKRGKGKIIQEQPKEKKNEIPVVKNSFTTEKGKRK